MKFNLKASTALSVFAAANVMLFNSAAIAQADTEGANDDSNVILVTAQKREQTLQEVPIAVSVFDSDTLERQNIGDIQDLATIAPTLSAPTGTQLTTTNFIIRGQGSSALDGSVEQSVGFFIDGVFRSRPASALGDFLDVARIEVLRGPQGSILGRNTSAGAVSVVLAEPEFELSGKVQADYGRFDNYGVSGTVTGPISDNIAGRLSASYRAQDKGTIINTAGPDDGTTERIAARGQLLFKLGEDTTIRLVGDYSDIDENCCGATPIFLSAVDVGTLTFLGANIPGLASATPDTVNGVAGVRLDPFDRVTAFNTPRNSQIEDWGITGHFNHSFGDIDLTAVASFRKFDANTTADFDSLDVPVGINFPGQTSRASEDINLELRLAGTSGPVEWLVGGAYFNQDLSATQTTAAFGIVGAGGNLDVESYAVFGQANISLSDNVELSAGLRYNMEDKTIRYFGTTLAPIVNANIGVPFSNDDNELIGDATLSYNFDRLNSIYVRFARGYKSPGLNTTPFSVLAVSVNDFIYDAEKSDAYEVGAKLTFSDAFSINTALFYQDISNLQVQVVDASTAVSFVDNVGSSRSFGAELDWILRPSENFTLTGAFAYLNAEYRSFLNGPQQSVRPGGIGFRDLSGQTPLQAPKFTVAMNAQYTADLGSSGLQLIPQADFIFRSEHTTSLANEDIFANDGTILINASIELASEDGWSIQLFGKNIFDEEIITYGTGMPTLNSGAVVINDPATWGIRTSFKF